MPGDVTWLAFTPQYGAPRRSQVKVLGAHAFRTGPRSLCGAIPRERAGGPASSDARYCVWCERVISGVSRDRSGADRHPHRAGQPAQRPPALGFRRPAQERALHGMEADLMANIQRGALVADLMRRFELASHGELRILERALQAIERRRGTTETDAPLMAMLFEEMLDIPIRAGAPEAIGLTPQQLRARTAAEVAAEDALRDPQVTARNAARMAERDDIRHDVRHARLRGAMATTEENAERDRRDEVTIGIPGDHWGDTIAVDDPPPRQPLTADARQRLDVRRDSAVSEVIAARPDLFNPAREFAADQHLTRVSGTSSPLALADVARDRGEGR